MIGLVVFVALLLVGCQEPSVTVTVDPVWQNVYAPHQDLNTVAAGECDTHVPYCVEVAGQFIPLPRNGVSLGPKHTPGTAVVTGWKPGPLLPVRLFRRSWTTGAFERGGDLYCPENHCVLRGEW